MAHKVEKFPEVVGQSVYPWAEWLDGDPWALEIGVDFKGKVETFRANAIVHAKKRGGRVRTRIVRSEGERPDVLYVQFYRDADAEAPAASRVTAVQ